MAVGFLERHERYLCAVKDGMHVHQVLRFQVETPVRVGAIRLTLQHIGEHQYIWQHLRGHMDGSWLQQCYEAITAEAPEGEVASDTSALKRLCQRVANPPRPYHEDAVTSTLSDV